MYYFLSGYTAKVAGTERGVTEPQATFSACFGEAFLPCIQPSTLSSSVKRWKKWGKSLFGQYRLVWWWLWSRLTDEH